MLKILLLALIAVTKLMINASFLTVFRLLHALRAIITGLFQASLMPKGSNWFRRDGPLPLNFFNILWLTGRDYCMTRDKSTWHAISLPLGRAIGLPLHLYMALVLTNRRIKWVKHRKVIKRQKRSQLWPRKKRKQPGSPGRVTWKVTKGCYIDYSRVYRWS